MMLWAKKNPVNFLVEVDTEEVLEEFEIAFSTAKSKANIAKAEAEIDSMSNARIKQVQEIFMTIKKRKRTRNNSKQVQIEAAKKKEYFTHCKT